MSQNYVRGDQTSGHKTSCQSYIGPQTYISDSYGTAAPRWNYSNVNVPPMAYTSQFSHSQPATRSNPLNSHLVSQCKSNALIRPAAFMNSNSSNCQVTARSHSSGFQNSCCNSSRSNTQPPRFAENFISQCEPEWSVLQPSEASNITREEITVSTRNLIQNLGVGRSVKMEEIQKGIENVKSDHSLILEKIRNIEDTLNKNTDNFSHSFSKIMEELSKISEECTQLKEKRKSGPGKGVDASTQTIETRLVNKTYSRKRKHEDSCCRLGERKEKIKMCMKKAETEELGGRGGNSDMKKLAQCFEEFGHYLKIREKFPSIRVQRKTTETITSLNGRVSRKHRVSVTVIDESNLVINRRRRRRLSKMKSSAVVAYSRKKKKTVIN